MGAMQKTLKTTNGYHLSVTARILLETSFLLIAAGWVAHLILGLAAEQGAWYIAYFPLLLFQGLLLQRVYIVGHEAAHRKLIPNHLGLNDFLGQLMLTPILVPVLIYRKVHMFHHGFNRKDHETSALDVFVSAKPITPLRRIYYHALWYLGVFGGGFFVHSLASIIIFLFVPTAQAEKVSPAFSRWRTKDRVMAWLQLLAGVAVHVTVAVVFGGAVWAHALGFPLLAFAWIWSLLVYIFHYHTTIGEHTRFNVRALRQHPFFSWLLMNFNQHTTHHMYPNLPWYELLNHQEELPQPFAEKNQTTGSFWQAIVNQLRGPTIVHKEDEDPTPHLFVRWED